jgi:hypothetical protein
MGHAIGVGTHATYSIPSKMRSKIIATSASLATAALSASGNPELPSPNTWTRKDSHGVTRTRADLKNAHLSDQIRDSSYGE